MVKPCKYTFTQDKRKNKSRQSDNICREPAASVVTAGAGGRLYCMRIDITCIQSMYIVNGQITCEKKPPTNRNIFQTGAKKSSPLTKVSFLFELRSC